MYKKHPRISVNYFYKINKEFGWFTMLMTRDGLGPKTALDILAQNDPQLGGGTPFRGRGVGSYWGKVPVCQMASLPLLMMSNAQITALWKRSIFWTSCIGKFICFCLSALIIWNAGLSSMVHTMCMCKSYVGLIYMKYISLTYCILYVAILSL